MGPQDAILSRSVFVLEEEFVIDQAGHVRQQPDPKGSLSYRGAIIPCILNCFDILTPRDSISLRESQRTPQRRVGQPGIGYPYPICLKTNAAISSCHTNSPLALIATAA